MPETESTIDQAAPSLTPRQDRIEAGIVEALRAGAPRSALREHVRSLAHLLRMQGHSADRAAGIIEALARRAAPLMQHDGASAAGDTPADRLGLMLRWSDSEFSRSD